MTALLFADPDFRKYLDHDSEFLTLVSHARKDTTHPRFARATNGLYRARQGKHWTTSFPGLSTDVIHHFADSVLEADSADVAHYLSRASNAPHQMIRKIHDRGQQSVLEGVLFGIRHFTRKEGGPSERATKIPESYMKFFVEALNTPGLPNEKYNSIDQIRRDVIGLAGEENLEGRSSLARAMERQQPDRKLWTTEWHRIWNTVVHAWNSNVAITVGARESIAPLPEALIPVRGKITDAAGPFKSADGMVRPTRLGVVPGFSLNPNELTWQRIAEIVREPRVHDQRLVLQKAFARQDSREIHDAAKTLVRSLREMLRVERHGDWAWSLLDDVSSFLPPPFDSILGTPGKIVNLRSTKERYMVWNTLNGFKHSLITVFDTGKRAA